MNTKECIVSNELDEKYVDVFNETHDLVLDKNQFIKDLTDVIEINDDGQLNRLEKWLFFFNQHAKYLPGIYEKLIFTLLSCYREYGFIHEQTTPQFNASKYFFSLIIKTKKSFSIVDTGTAFILFQISLIQASRPHLVKRSIFKSLFELNEFLTLVSVKKLFSSVFVINDNLPFVITKHIDLLNHKEWLVIIDMLEGKNIRKSKHLPLPLSKKESQILRTKLPCVLSFEENVILRLIVISKLLVGSKRYDKHYINTLFDRSDTFKENPELFIRDIDFWRNAFKILLNFKSEDGNITPVEVLDFFEYKKYNSTDGFSLKGRTIRSIERVVHEWHVSSSFDYLLDYKSKKWEAKYKNTQLIYNNKTYAFIEVTKGEDLFKESSIMKHCVYSYIDKCISSKISIFSVRVKQENKTKRLLTIEVSKGAVVQVRGKANRFPSVIELSLIEKWANTLRLTLDF